MENTLQRLLRRASERQGGRIAVIDRARSLSYSELDRRSDQVANLLRALGVVPGDRVGLYLEKSLESIIGLYGVMKAGAAYVPLDPGAPVQRLAYIASNCGIKVLLTGVEKRASWGGLLDAGAPVRALVALNDTEAGAADPPAGFEYYGADEVDRQDGTPPQDRTISHDLAYILYTSGSTGDPKGVMLTHRNALTFVEWAAEEFALTPEDRLSSHAPLHFDLSVFDVFAAAWSGAAVVLVPGKASLFPVELARFIRQNELTVWYSVPSILSMLVLRGGLAAGDLPTLRTLLFAGEVFPTKYLRQLMEALPGVRFANLYGPTETNVCTWYEVPDLPDLEAGTIPIGRPVADVEVFAITEEGRRAETGEVGELHVRGSTVMRGYWGDPERTARSLVPDPSREEPRDLVYRTGDLAFEDEAGDWHYLGRRDSQIKSRGYRIELGEIEVALYAFPGVTQCTVIAIPDELVTNRIKAFVVGVGAEDERALAVFCAERLPRYMIPELWEFRDDLPKTSTGKIDRKVLAPLPA
jgi:amino acid adenylation domain-containing protein